MKEIKAYTTTDGKVWTNYSEAVAHQEKIDAIARVNQYFMANDIEVKYMDEDDWNEMLERHFFAIRNLFIGMMGVDNKDYRIQSLINICFQVAITVNTEEFFCQRSNEDIAKWVADQLRQCGFDTKPCGSSWGVLK